MFSIAGNTTGTTRTYNLPNTNNDTAVVLAFPQTLTNKTLDATNSITAKDSTFTVQDDADATKQFRFQASGITTGTTRTFTLPNVTDTLVTLGATQTLTNKSLDDTNSLTIKTGNLSIEDSTDTTKRFLFDASVITTSTQRTYTMPDANTTLVGTATTQTLTNKDISSSSNTYRAITQSVSGVDTSSGQRLGTNTNDNASAGNIGEYKESNVTTSQNVSVVSNYFEVASVTLTAGDWDVSGCVMYQRNGATYTTTDFVAAISSYATTASTDITAPLNTVDQSGVLPVGFTQVMLPIGPIRVTSNGTDLTVAGTTHTGVQVIYVKGFTTTPTAGTGQYRGFIRARRVR